MQKTKNDNNAKQLNSKISKLESLCRALQEDRNKNPAPNGVVPAGQKRFLVLTNWLFQMYLNQILNIFCFIFDGILWPFYFGVY